MADLLEVARFATLPEGELAVALLNRHGIPARLADRDAATINPDLLFALGGVRVVAPNDCIAEARSLIARVREDALADDSDDWMDDATPGRVGELDDAEISGVMGWSKKAGVVVVLLAFVVFPVAGCVYSWFGY